jgi:hypothetical protein
MPPKSRLGGALLLAPGRAAEPLLRQGYERMNQRASRSPPLHPVHRTEALERLVQLSDAWGKPDEAAKR